MVRLPRIWGGSSSASNANYTSQCIHQTHVAYAGTTSTMVSLATMPSAVTKIARNVHTILLIVTFLLSYPLSWCKQDTSTQTPNWTSKHTYTSNLTPLHETVWHIILQPKPHLPPLLPLQHHWRRCHHYRNHTTPKMSHIWRHHPNHHCQCRPPSSNAWKMQTWMHQQTSNCHHPTWSWSMATKSLVNSTTKTWHSSQSRLPPSPILVQCSNLSWYPLSHALKSHDLLPITSRNSTAPMPTLPYVRASLQTALHTRHPHFSRLLLETIRLTHTTHILR